MFKVNNKNTRTHKMVKQTQKICRQKPKNCLRVFDHFVRSGVFIVNFEQISHLFLVFLLLTLNK